MNDNRILILNQFNEDEKWMKTEITRGVITLEPNSSIHDVLLQMKQNFIKRIVIVEKDKPVGIVTERDINKYLENDKTSKFLDEIPIKNVMTKSLITMHDGIDDHLEQCAMRMETFKIGSVILVDGDGKLIGIVSKTDITKAYSIIYSGKYHVKDFMSQKLITCRESDSLEFALNMINRNNVSRLVVTDNNGKPMGIISTNTFLTHSEYFTDNKTKTRNYLYPYIGSDKQTVQDLVKNNLLTVEDEDDLAKAATLMTENKVSGIPVVDSNQNLVGIIDKSDIVLAFNHLKPNEKLSVKYGDLY